MSKCLEHDVLWACLWGPVLATLINVINVKSGQHDSLGVDLKLYKGGGRELSATMPMCVSLCS